MVRLNSLWLLLLAPILFSCQSAGTLVYERQLEQADGNGTSQRFVLRTPSDAVHPGTLTVEPGGIVVASTGAQAKISAASRSLAKLPFVGAGLLVVGIVLVVLKAKLPMLPLELGLGVAGTGLALLVLPSLIEAYLPYIFIGIVASIVLFMVFRLNKTSLRLKQIDPADPTPNPKQTDDQTP